MKRFLTSHGRRPPSAEAMVMDDTCGQGNAGQDTTASLMMAYDEDIDDALDDLGQGSSSEDDSWHDDAGVGRSAPVMMKYTAGIDARQGDRGLRKRLEDDTTQDNAGQGRSATVGIKYAAVKDDMRDDMGQARRLEVRERKVSDNEGSTGTEDLTLLLPKPPDSPSYLKHVVVEPPVTFLSASRRQPAPTSSLTLRDDARDQCIIRLRKLLHQNKIKEVRMFLQRAVKADSKKAVFRMLRVLEEEGQDLCSDEYRDEESTASILHIALLYKRVKVCEKLIAESPRLARLKYRGKMFDNQTTFHIAAANGYLVLIRCMMEKIDDIQEKRNFLNTRADGRYFVEDRPEASLCLSAAAWSGNANMIRELISLGADLEARGTFGNTLLHFIVYLSTTILPLETAITLFNTVYECSNVWWKNYREVTKKTSGCEDELRFDAFCHLLGIRNHAGLIPAALSIKLHSPLTAYILSFQPVYKLKQTVKFGATAWATYDVTDILSFRYTPGSKIGWAYCGSSVLHILAHTAKVLSTSEGDGRIKDVAEIEPIKSTIRMKWNLYRWILIPWLLVHTFYMIALTCTTMYYHDMNTGPQMTINNGATAQTAYKTDNSTMSGMTGHVLGREHNLVFGLFLVLPFLYSLLEIFDLFHPDHGRVESEKLGMKKHGSRLVGHFKDNCTITGNAPFRIVAVAFSICMFVWWGLYVNDNENCDIPLSLAMILGWIFMLYFTRACRHVCRFSVMIQKMFFRDFLYFFAVYLFILMAFSAGMHILSPPNFGAGSTIFGLLNVITNAEESDHDVTPVRKSFATVLLSVYALVTVILLLNMLIAMMNTSYESVKSSPTNLWRHQQLSILLMLERRFFWLPYLCKRSQSDVFFAKLPHSSGQDVFHQRAFLDVTEQIPLKSE